MRCRNARLPGPGSGGSAAPAQPHGNWITCRVWKEQFELLLGLCLHLHLVLGEGPVLQVHIAGFLATLVTCGSDLLLEVVHPLSYRRPSTHHLSATKAALSEQNIRLGCEQRGRDPWQPWACWRRLPAAGPFSSRPLPQALLSPPRPLSLRVPFGRNIFLLEEMKIKIQPGRVAPLASFPEKGSLPAPHAGPGRRAPSVGPAEVMRAIKHIHY